MDPALERLVTVMGRRIFFDIATCGCGSGCKYCYVKSSEIPQSLISIDDAMEIANNLIRLYSGKSMIISFCPNTEPFKSNSSKDIILSVIEKLSTHGFIFQISTKEVISDETLSRVNSMCSFPKQVFFNISIPMITESGHWEPKCSPVMQRFHNIQNISRHESLTSCLYIKPFLEETLKDRTKFFDLLKIYPPDYIVIGFEFADKSAVMPCTMLHNPETASQLSIKDLSKMGAFAKEMKDSFPQITNFSSVCNVNQCFSLQCEIQLNKYDELYCDGCLLCKGEV
ncbi:MAG: hypothetical protein LBB91_06055 [Clostridiales bacterium]|jgi:hypothetical protein|nr:hypothetical protein [Clostridiales bacterium]